MDGIVKAGAKAWFEVKFRGADVATFEFDTPVTYTQMTDAPWVKADNVPGFPTDHPTILIHKDDLSN